MNSGNTILKINLYLVHMMLTRKYFNLDFFSNPFVSKPWLKERLLNIFIHRNSVT